MQYTGNSPSYLCLYKTLGLMLYLLHVLCIHPSTHPPTGHEVLSSLCLCLAAYLSLYPVVLIFPFMIMSYRVREAVIMHSWHVVFGVGACLKNCVSTAKAYL